MTKQQKELIISNLDWYEKAIYNMYNEDKLTCAKIASKSNIDEEEIISVIARINKTLQDYSIIK